MHSWSKPALVDVPVYPDALGSLGVIEGGGVFPFPIMRVYFLYDVPAEATRGSHAHKNLHQLIIPVAGSFTVRLDDGNERTDYALDRPSAALAVPPGYWRTLTNFSAGSAAVVIASQEYDDDDYIRSYDEFLEWTKR